MTTITKKNTATNLKSARIRAGLSLADLASRLGVTTQTICNYESGRTELGEAMAVRWAAACSVKDYRTLFFRAGAA